MKNILLPGIFLVLITISLSCSKEVFVSDKANQ